MDNFEAFFAEHYSSVVRAIALAVGDRGRAEELSQEAFARACRRWRSVSAMERPWAWVYVVALNEERRRWRRDRPREVEAAARVQTAPDHAGTVLTSLSLRAALDQLTARQRAAVVLRYLADLSVADVAAAMGCAEGTAKATLHQALRRMRIEMEDDDEG